MKDDKKLAYIQLNDATAWKFNFIAELHDVVFEKINDEFVINEENLTRLLYFIDNAQYDVSDLRNILQNAGKNKFNW